MESLVGSERRQKNEMNQPQIKEKRRQTDSRRPEGRGQGLTQVGNCGQAPAGRSFPGRVESDQLLRWG